MSMHPISERNGAQKAARLFPALAAALLALLATACVNSSDPAGTPDAQTELRALATKVRYLDLPDAEQAMGRNPNGGFDKKSAQAPAKAAAAMRMASECEQEGESIETGADPTARGTEAIFEDTVRSFTASGALLCGFEDMAAYTTIGHHSKDDQLETWQSMRIDFSPDPGADEWYLKLTGSGKVQYATGYVLDMESFKIILGYNGISEFSLTLGLEGGYTAKLNLAPGAGQDMDSEPDPAALLLSGPILKDGAQVGTFELHGDDSVTIRDAAGVEVTALD